MEDVSAKPTFIKSLAKKIERPMFLLSFVWLIVIIAELVNGMNQWLLVLGTVLWALFVFYFGLRLGVAPHRTLFLRRNWIFILAIVVPILRFFPFLQRVPLARALTATFGMQVVWIFASADQGLRYLRVTLGSRGLGFVLTFTTIVIFAGAAGMFYFEQNSPGPQGIHSYPKALWWVAMQITNIGSGFFPMTSGGRLVCLAISIFAAAMFGYLTAVFATFFIGQEAKDPKSAIANQTSIHQLSSEIALLRKLIEDIAGRLPPSQSKSVHKESQVKPRGHSKKPK
jgi:voltage-gated potassium channel